ncbi:MAG: succinyldiaminopimelate transaminase [Pseudomonadota bacterium]
MMNPDLNKLQSYPFEKLNKLKAGLSPPLDLSHLALFIGEPKHSTPEFIKETLIENLHGLANYPITKGEDTLRETIANWLKQRFHLDHIDPAKQILPVNGTREALFSFAQAVIDREKNPVVLMPNPFYQIYEGAAFLAGAEPVFINCPANKHFYPDFERVDKETWQRCQLLYLCSPNNPTGAVLDLKTLQKLINLAEKHDFIIASDECYSELYFDEENPPIGLLQAAEQMGNHTFKRCVVFHSLSKRSNVPGLRSGFVAGDAKILEKFFLYRTYHGCAMPPPIQKASIAAWKDEEHVKENRALYREKFKAFFEILSPVMPLQMPQAGFYFWLQTPFEEELFTQRLFEQQHITVLPGSYLSRKTALGNPGENRVRIALVASVEECTEAAQRIRRFIQQLSK